MRWRIHGNTKQSRQPAESSHDRLQRSAGNSGQRRVHRAQLDYEQCDFRQRERSWHLSRQWLDESHSHNHDHLYGDSSGAGRNNKVIHRCERRNFRSDAHDYFQCAAQQRCPGCFGSSELVDQQCDIGEHRWSWNIWGEWIDERHSGFHYGLRRNGDGPGRIRFGKYHSSCHLESAYDFIQRSTQRHPQGWYGGVELDDDQCNLREYSGSRKFPPERIDEG